MRSWLREPLLQFLLAGALLFALHKLWQRHAPDPQLISITPALKAELAHELHSELGRDASAAELGAALETWKAEEILYREGVRMGLEQGDPLVRRRVASKMLELERDLTVTREPTPAELDAFLQQNLERYSEPPRYDFEHVYLARDRGDGSALSRARALVRELAAGGAVEGKGDSFEAGATLSGRTADNLRQLFGENFARRVPDLELGRWQLVESVHGWHVVRLTRITPAQPIERSVLSPKLLRDWKLAQRSSSGSILRSELGKKYVFKEAP